MYFPFFILHDWGKSSAEARGYHLSGVAKEMLVYCAGVPRNRGLKKIGKLL